MSTLDFRDLPEERLATTDEEGRRLWIIPARVRGYWKNRKTVFHIILLMIFTLTPWLRISGKPILLFDIQNRQFVFFGNVFASHDAPLLFFVFAILGFSLIVVTALWGRLWCGWACPQTVFIEQVFRRIESFAVGGRGEQLAANREPLKWKYLKRLVFKWSLFILASLILSHSFIAYFVSWENLLSMMSKPPGESWTVFVTVLVFTGVILFDFAWFREQFCIIMCPYGRFQSVLMDQNSITVTYDYKRGEPRHKGLNKDENQKVGDCIDCFKCVSVCPTGIDIRRGQQLECISCTACIDACDEVMERINRPKGLVRYAALADLEKSGRRFWRPRVVVYLSILGILISGFIFALNQHQKFYFNVLRQNQRPYVVASEYLLNNFKFHIKNPSFSEFEYKISLIEQKGVEMAPPVISGNLSGNEDVQRPFFIKLIDWEARNVSEIQLLIEYSEKNGKADKATHSVRLVYPK